MSESTTQTRGPGDSDQLALKALRSLVVECKELRQLEELLGQFNIFSVLKMDDYEIRHSNLIAWLLTPNESHGLGELFLRRFLMQVYHDAEPEEGGALDPVEIDALPFSEVTIHREHGNMDLLIKIQVPDESWVICIENKVRSKQATNQLTKYRERVNSMFPGSRCQFIFLTMENEPPEDPYFTPARYSQIHNILEMCKSERSTSIGPEPALVINHYLNLLRHRHMPDSQVEKLARQIYAAHKQALDIILSNRPDALMKLSNGIEEKLKSASRDLKIRPLLFRKGMAYFVPIKWDLPQNKQGESWTTVVCEINTWQNNVIVKAFVGPPADNKWRQGAHKLSHDNKFPNTINKKKISEKWHTFYAIKGVELKIENAPTEIIEERINEVWNSCLNILSSESFDKMVTVMASEVIQLPNVDKSLNTPLPPEVTP